MKLSAVAIAAAFAGGILLGYSPLFAEHATVSRFLVSLALLASLCLALGLLLVWRNLPWFAAVASLSAWIALGILAACMAEQPLSPEHILARFSTQQIPRQVPLRWH